MLVRGLGDNYGQKEEIPQDDLGFLPWEHERIWGPQEEEQVVEEDKPTYSPVVLPVCRGHPKNVL